MPVKFRCSECTQKLRIDDVFAGKLVSCVRCGAKQRVPLESTPEFAESNPKPNVAKPNVTEPEFQAEPSRPAAAQTIPSKPLKPWQPPPVREQPLPSEPRPVQSDPREYSPDALSQDALSAIFDQPVVPVAPDLREQGHEIDGGEPDFSSPEFVAEPLIAAGSRHFESERVPAQDGVEGEPGFNAAVAVHEPSLVPPAKKLDMEELIDMTAMVDIVFFLLIFFLVTSMHSLDSTIPMPTPDPQKAAAREPQTVAAIDADESYVVVRIDKNDKITVEGTEVRSERDLLFKLRDLRLGAARPEKLLVIGHGDATHGTAVMILDAGRELGMDQVKLTVQDEDE